MASIVFIALKSLGLRAWPLFVMFGVISPAMLISTVTVRRDCPRV